MRSTFTTGLFALLFAAACGGPSQQSAAHNGDENTGAMHDSQRDVRTSGDELAAGNCEVTPVYFQFDSSELDPSARAALESNARCLAARNASARVIGLTDPRGTEEYNLALGDRRAQTVTHYMANMGVDQSHLSTHSLGEETARGEDESGWMQDRRADIQVQ
jgi:peptidoglycan-associated lipoprotein